MRKDKISLDEELLVCGAWRYGIGRRSYYSTVASYIGKKYYKLFSDERLEFNAKDIRTEIANQLSFGITASFKYEYSVMEEERNPIKDLIEWKSQYKGDLAVVKEILCYKDSYSKDTPKKFEVITTDRIRDFKMDLFEINHLLNWDSLASLFDKKGHKQVTIEYNNEIKTLECFPVWVQKTVPFVNGSDTYYQRVEGEYEVAYVNVNKFLKTGNFGLTLNPDYIKSVE
jgi:hypothetical protein